MAVALVDFWQSTGRMAQGPDYFGRALSVPRAGDGLRAEALFHVGLLAFWQGEDEAAQDLHQSLDLSRRLGDPTGTPGTKRLARIAQRSDLNRARELSQQALDTDVRRDRHRPLARVGLRIIIEGDRRLQQLDSVAPHRDRCRLEVHVAGTQAQDPPRGAARTRPPATPPPGIAGDRLHQRDGLPRATPPADPSPRSACPTPGHSPAAGTFPPPAGSRSRPGTAGPAAGAAPSWSAPGRHRPVRTAGTALIRPDGPGRTPPRRQ
jgi:hypothetical protein